MKFKFVMYHLQLTMMDRNMFCKLKALKKALKKVVKTEKNLHFEQNCSIRNDQIQTQYSFNYFDYKND